MKLSKEEAEKMKKLYNSAYELYKLIEVMRPEGGFENIEEESEHIELSVGNVLITEATNRKYIVKERKYIGQELFINFIRQT